MALLERQRLIETSSNGKSAIAFRSSDSQITMPSSLLFFYLLKTIETILSRDEIIVVNFEGEKGTWEKVQRARIPDSKSRVGESKGAGQFFYHLKSNLRN